MEREDTTLDALYKARRGRVDLIAVPLLGYLVVAGQGDPNGPGFADAVQSLYAVSYGAHFLAKKELGQAPKVRPLEAQWWVDDPKQQDIVMAVALGGASMADTDRDDWRWQAMIMQPAPLDEGIIARAIDKAREKPLASLERLEYVCWEEGLCAQTLHVGPFADEAPTIVALHEGLTAAGYRPRGRHHEIYLSDPRRSAPEKLRTLLRHPVEPAPG